MGLPATVYTSLSHGELKDSLFTVGTFLVRWYHVSVCLLRPTLSQSSEEIWEEMGG